MNVTLKELYEWHENQCDRLSPFGPASEEKKFHETVLSALRKNASERASMAAAIVTMPAYQTHDAEVFNTNHRIAVEIAAQIAKGK